MINICNLPFKYLDERGVEGGGVEGKSGLKSLSTPQDHITDKWKLAGFHGVCGCTCGELIWTYLVWAKWSVLESFWMPSHRLNSATGEQKGITQTLILTLSWRVGCLTHSRAKLRSANIPAFTFLLWCGWGSKIRIHKMIQAGLRKAT